MTEQEKYVREHWEWVHCYDPCPDEPFFEVKISDKTATLDIGEFPAQPGEQADVCWSAAADFTRQRLEEIRQVEREIEWLTPYASGSAYSYVFRPSHLAELVRLDCAPYRILAREQSALAELRKGMRDGQ